MGLPDQPGDRSAIRYDMISPKGPSHVLIRACRTCTDRLTAQGEFAAPHHNNPLIACSEGLDRPDEDKEPLQRTSSSLQRSGLLKGI